MWDFCWPERVSNKGHGNVCGAKCTLSPNLCWQILSLDFPNVYVLLERKVLSSREVIGRSYGLPNELQMKMKLGTVYLKVLFGVIKYSVPSLKSHGNWGKVIDFKFHWLGKTDVYTHLQKRRRNTRELICSEPCLSPLEDCERRWKLFLHILRTSKWLATASMDIYKTRLCLTTLILIQD